MRDRPRPFISYARENQRDAIQLYGDLCAMGAEPWFDAIALVPGDDDWEHTIRQALANSTHFIALISHHSVNKRGFVQKELKQALELLREFPPGEIFLIPVRLENVEPRQEELKRIHWVDLFADRDAALQKVARSLQLHGTSSGRRNEAHRKQASARQVWSGQRMRAAARWLSIGVNDFLQDYDNVEKQLRRLGIEHDYRFSARGGAQPSSPPVYRVIVAGPDVGMTVLRHVCAAVGPTGEGFVQLWNGDIREHTIAIGAYGYGGQKAARLDPNLLNQMRTPAFTKNRLQRWIDEHSGCDRMTGTPLSLGIRTRPGTSSSETDRSVPPRAWAPAGEHASFGMSRGRLRSMPTIRRNGPYRFYFYSGDLGEPRHVHVDAGESTAKFWLTPVSLHYNIGFSARELRSIERIVLDHRQVFVEAWDAYFGT